jgi:hypothetical protein
MRQPGADSPDIPIYPGTAKTRARLFFEAIQLVQRLGHQCR